MTSTNANHPTQCQKKENGIFLAPLMISHPRSMFHGDDDATSLEICVCERYFRANLPHLRHPMCGCIRRNQSKLSVKERTDSARSENIKLLSRREFKSCEIMLSFYVHVTLHRAWR